jgi:hypothetical protein
MDGVATFTIVASAWYVNSMASQIKAAPAAEKEGPLIRRSVGQCPERIRIRCLARNGACQHGPHA